MFIIFIVKKVTVPSPNVIGSGGTPWHHPGSSPSSLSSGGSVSPPAVDPSPSKTGNIVFHNAMQLLKDFLFLLQCSIVIIQCGACICGITNLDASEVWLPPHPSDFGLGDKKSHFWQNAPVTDWSKEQVSVNLH